MADTAIMPDTAEPAATAGQDQSRLKQILNNINALSQQQKIAGAVAIALSIALIVGTILWNRQPDYAVLFSNLDEHDGGVIINTLQQQNVPYRISPDGRAILVQKDQVHAARLRLAADGLPQGGLIGFELLEKQKLGISQFAEQVNYQRALEGELARTIQSIASVAGARVHLAIPKQTAFLRNDQKPTASIMVNMRPGRSLDENQIAGIVHLVSSSVPRLTAEGVNIIDQNGDLLTSKSDPLRRAGLDATQLEYVKEIEKNVIRRIENILVPIVGKDNFRAQVSADVDFNEVEQTAETYKPNPAPDQAIRSQQTTEEINPLRAPQGIPGALSNQPPVPATAPITTPPVPAGQGINNQQGLNISNRSAIINYEVDRTIQHIRQSLGQIKRISVAVVVNNRQETGPGGAVQSIPLSEEELNRISNLVREAVGYNAARGDTINVASSAFAPKEVEPGTPIWKDPDMLEVGKQGFQYLTILLIILFIYLLVLRPLLRTVMPPPAEQTREEENEEDEDAEVSLSPEALAGNSYEAKLERSRQLTREDPKLVSNLIKEWLDVNEEGRK